MHILIRKLAVELYRSKVTQYGKTIYSRLGEICQVFDGCWCYGAPYLVICSREVGLTLVISSFNCSTIIRSEL